MLAPGLKRIARRALPQFLIDQLDPVDAVIRAEVLEAAAQGRSDEVVLDAGAGEARHRGYFTHARYVAVDVGCGDPAWDYSGLDARADLASLPLRSGSIDRVLCMVVLEHTRDPRRVLEEFARVLRPGGSLHMVVPFLWEEHQAPHDYFRFTRYGIRLLFEGLPLQVELVRPLGGFFAVCARRSINLLGFFQGSWRWPLLVVLAPVFGFALPLALRLLDGLDRGQTFSLGFRVRARRST